MSIASNSPAPRPIRRYDEWRELQPWPAHCHFEDGPVEKRADRFMPARPDIISCIGNSSMATVDCAYAEGSERRGLRRGYRGPSAVLRAAWAKKKASRAAR
jgi:hypothetical protein